MCGTLPHIHRPTPKRNWPVKLPELCYQTYTQIEHRTWVHTCEQLENYCSDRVVDGIVSCKVWATHTKMCWMDAARQRDQMVSFIDVLIIASLLSFDVCWVHLLCALPIARTWSHLKTKQTRYIHSSIRAELPTARATCIDMFDKS